MGPGVPGLLQPQPRSRNQGVNIAMRLATPIRRATPPSPSGRLSLWGGTPAALSAHVLLIAEINLPVKAGSCYRHRSSNLCAVLIASSSAMAMNDMASAIIRAPSLYSSARRSILMRRSSSV